MRDAVTIYRDRFRPSDRLAAPYVMLGVNIFAADTDAAARRLFSSQQQAFVNLRRGRPGKLPPPVDDFEAGLDRYGRDARRRASCSVVGGPETVRDRTRGIRRLDRCGRTDGDRRKSSTTPLANARLRSWPSNPSPHEVVKPAACDAGTPLGMDDRMHQQAGRSDQHAPLDATDLFACVITLGIDVCAASFCVFHALAEYCPIFKWVKQHQRLSLDISLYRLMQVFLFTIFEKASIE